MSLAQAVGLLALDPKSHSKLKSFSVTQEMGCSSIPTNIKHKTQNTEYAASKPKDTYQMLCFS